MKRNVFAIITAVILITVTLAGAATAATVGHCDRHSHETGCHCDNDAHEAGTCPSCYGSSVCRVCNGSGVLTNGDKCSMCNGSGDCYYCSGTGKI